MKTTTNPGPKNPGLPTHYSPYKSHNRELAKMSWDDAWEAFTAEGLADRYVEEYRKSNGRRGYHRNSRSAKCLKAWERGVRVRMRELDREATGNDDFCRMIFAV